MKIVLGLAVAALVTSGAWHPPAGHVQTRWADPFCTPRGCVVQPRPPVRWADPVCTIRGCVFQPAR